MFRNTKLWSRFLEVLALASASIISGAFLLKWFYGDFPVYGENPALVTQKDVSLAIGYWHTKVYATTPPAFIIRILAALVDLVSVALLVWGLICLVKLLRYYAQNELFSKRTLALYSRISRIALIWTLYNPVKFSLLTLITTLSNPTGQRTIAVMLTQDDVVHVFIAGCFVLLTSVIHSAHTLKHEQDLTV